MLLTCTLGLIKTIDLPKSSIYFETGFSSLDRGDVVDTVDAASSICKHVSGPASYVRIPPAVASLAHRAFGVPFVSFSCMFHYLDIPGKASVGWIS